MNGWRKRQIADKIEDDMTNSKSFMQWYEENNVEITWCVIGILIMGTLDSLTKGHYWFAAWTFFLLIGNYLLRKHGFRK